MHFPVKFEDVNAYLYWEILLWIVFLKIMTIFKIRGDVSLFKILIGPKAFKYYTIWINEFTYFIDSIKRHNYSLWLSWF